MRKAGHTPREEKPWSGFIIMLIEGDAARTATERHTCVHAKEEIDSFCR